MMNKVSKEQIIGQVKTAELVAKTMTIMAVSSEQKDYKIKQLEGIVRICDTRAECMKSFIERHGLRGKFEEEHSHALDERCTCHDKD